MAFGDVLMTTPVVRRLKAKGCEVYVQSSYAHLFENNPDVAGANVGPVDIKFDRVIDLDMAHEVRRKQHAAVAYMQAAFGDNGNGHDLSIFFDYGAPPDIGIDYQQAIMLHPNVSWRNRMLPPAWWNKVADIVASKGYKVVVTGTARDFNLNGHIDTRDKFGPRDQAAMIDAAASFGCGPSGLFILTGATRARAVTFLTINRAETCLPYRHGQLGWGYRVLPTSMPCIGCSERAAPTTFLGCERNDYACISTFAPNDFAEMLVAAAVERAGVEGWSLP